MSNSREERGRAASAPTRKGGVCVSGQGWGEAGSASQPWRSRHLGHTAQMDEVYGVYGALGPYSLSQVLWLAFDFLLELQCTDTDTLNEGCLPN